MLSRTIWRRAKSFSLPLSKWGNNGFGMPCDEAISCPCKVAKQAHGRVMSGPEECMALLDWDRAFLGLEGSSVLLERDNPEQCRVLLGLFTDTYYRHTGGHES